MELELEFQVPGASAPDESAVVEWVRGALMEALEESLDMFRHDGDIAIDRLEIDLGRFGLEAFRAEAPERLKRLLVGRIDEARRGSPKVEEACRDVAVAEGAGEWIATATEQELLDLVHRRAPGLYDLAALGLDACGDAVASGDAKRRFWMDVFESCEAPASIAAGRLSSAQIAEAWSVFVAVRPFQWREALALWSASRAESNDRSGLESNPARNAGMDRRAASETSPLEGLVASLRRSGASGRGGLLAGAAPEGASLRVATGMRDKDVTESDVRVAGARESDSVGARATDPESEAGVARSNDGVDPAHATGSRREMPAAAGASVAVDRDSAARLLESRGAEPRAREAATPGAPLTPVDGATESAINAVPVSNAKRDASEASRSAGESLGVAHGAASKVEPLPQAGVARKMSPVSDSSQPVVDADSTRRRLGNAADAGVQGSLEQVSEAGAARLESGVEASQAKSSQREALLVSDASVAGPVNAVESGAEVPRPGEVATPGASWPQVDVPTASVINAGPVSNAKWEASEASRSAGESHGVVHGAASKAGPLPQAGAARKMSPVSDSSQSVVDADPAMQRIVAAVDAEAHERLALLSDAGAACLESGAETPQAKNSQRETQVVPDASVAGPVNALESRAEAPRLGEVATPDAPRSQDSAGTESAINAGAVSNARRDASEASRSAGESLGVAHGAASKVEPLPQAGVAGKMPPVSVSSQSVVDVDSTVRKPGDAFDAGTQVAQEHVGAMGAACLESGAETSRAMLSRSEALSVSEALAAGPVNAVESGGEVSRPGEVATPGASWSKFDGVTGTAINAGPVSNAKRETSEASRSAGESHGVVHGAASKAEPLPQAGAARKMSPVSDSSQSVVDADSTMRRLGNAADAGVQGSLEPVSEAGTTRLESGVETSRATLSRREERSGSDASVAGPVNAVESHAEAPRLGEVAKPDAPRSQDASAVDSTINAGPVSNVEREASEASRSAGESQGVAQRAAREAEELPQAGVAGKVLPVSDSSQTVVDADPAMQRIVAAVDAETHERLAPLSEAGTTRLESGMETSRATLSRRETLSVSDALDSGPVNAVESGGEVPRLGEVATPGASWAKLDGATGSAINAGAASNARREASEASRNAAESRGVAHGVASNAEELPQAGVAGKMPPVSDSSQPVVDADPAMQRIVAAVNAETHERLAPLSEAGTTRLESRVETSRATLSRRETLSVSDALAAGPVNAVESHAAAPRLGEVAKPDAPRSQDASAADSAINAGPVSNVEREASEASRSAGESRGVAQRAARGAEVPPQAGVAGKMPPVSDSSQSVVDADSAMRRSGDATDAETHERLAPLSEAGTTRLENGVETSRATLSRREAQSVLDATAARARSAIEARGEVPRPGEVATPSAPRPHVNAATESAINAGAVSNARREASEAARNAAESLGVAHGVASNAEAPTQAGVARKMPPVEDSSRPVVDVESTMRRSGGQDFGTEMVPPAKPEAPQDPRGDAAHWSAESCVYDDAALRASLRRIPLPHRQTILDSILHFAQRSSRPDVFVRNARSALEGGETLDLDAIFQRVESRSSDTGNRSFASSAEDVAEGRETEAGISDDPRQAAYQNPSMETSAENDERFAPPRHLDERDEAGLPSEIAELLRRIAAHPSEARMELHQRLVEAASHAHLLDELAQVARRVLVNRSLPELASFLSDCEGLSMRSETTPEASTHADASETIPAFAQETTGAKGGVAGPSAVAPRPDGDGAAMDAIEHAIRQVPDMDSSLALQCVDMVTEIVLRFAREPDRARIRHAGREICYHELVHKNVPFHPRKLSETLLTGFQGVLPSLEPRTVATMILRRLSLPPFAPPPRTAPAAVRSFARDDDQACGAGAYVGNAGLVLAGQYLPRLFSMLDLVDAGAFRDDAARSRALHVLYWLAKGRVAPEGQDFGLERVLCGAPSDWVHEDGIRLEERETVLCDQLLAGIVQNWKVLGNTSPQGLRETFLDRSGVLRMQDETWHLEVVPGTFDMLIDRIPWGYSTIRHPWMEFLLQTKWRDA